MGPSVIEPTDSIHIGTYAKSRFMEYNIAVQVQRHLVSFGGEGAVSGTMASLQDASGKFRSPQTA